MRRIRAAWGLLAAAALVAAGTPGLMAQAPRYDLVLRGGRVVDGTGNPWRLADVAVRGDRIVSIGALAAGSGRREIDARGRVVAPGFIDAHSHSDYTLLEDGHAESKIRQGVTTEVLGEGGSVGPFVGELAAKEVTARGRTLSWRRVSEYLDLIDRLGTSLNVATFVGVDNVWQSVMGQSHARPSAEQFQRMRTLVSKSMKEGAFGLSSMLAMPPGSLAKTDDLVLLARAAAEQEGLFSTHNRNEGTGVMGAIDEAITISEQARLPVDIIHLKIADQQLWRRMPEIVARIEAARKRGHDVQANVYPYTRGSNNLASIIPPWVHEGGSKAMLERLRNPALRERIRREVTGGIPGWYNHYTAIGGDWSRMLIAAPGPLQGKTMDRILAERGPAGSDLLDRFFELLIENGGTVATVYEHHTEEDMTLAMRQPWCSIGSDGSAFATSGPLRRGNPHPRSFGTFPRVLGVYVREKNTLRLEDAVRKMTSLNAAKLGLTDRGILRPGNFADITVFDPQTVVDRATYTDPFQYPVGIEHVVVNGTVVLEAGRHTNAQPGKALRHRAMQGETAP